MVKLFDTHRTGPLEALLHSASIAAHTLVLWGTVLPAVSCSCLHHIRELQWCSLEQCRSLANSLPGRDSGQRVSWWIRYQISIAFAGQACVALKIEFPEMFSRLWTLLVFMNSICCFPQPRILPTLKIHTPGPTYLSSQLQDGLLVVTYNTGMSRKMTFLESEPPEWLELCDLKFLKGSQFFNVK